MSEWPSVQHPGPEITGLGLWRLDRWPLIHIRSIINFLYPCVMLQFYPSWKWVNFVFKYIKYFYWLRKSYYWSDYLQLSWRNWSAKSAIGRCVLVYVYEYHDITAHDDMATKSKIRDTAHDVITTKSKIRATKSGH